MNRRASMLTHLSPTTRVWLGVCATCAVTLLGCVTTPVEQPAVEALLAAEATFSRMAAERGIRASCLARFSADGLLFQPAPVRVHEVWAAARPAPADPLALQLDWTPAAAAVAASGEMGYTTGPFTLTDRASSRPPQHGIYTSVWRKNVVGEWQVLLHAEVPTNAATEPATLLPAPKLRGAASKPNFPQMLSPADIERSIRNSPLETFASWLATDARWYRSGNAPILLREPLATALHADWRAVSLSNTAGGGSATGDFAYTYGVLETEGTGASRSAGHYVNLWSRDDYGVWRIAVAVWLQPSANR